MCILKSVKCGSSWHRSFDEFEMKIRHSFGRNFYFIAQAVPEDQANHKPRANEFLYFQLVTGVIDVKFRLDITNGRGRHAFKLHLS